MSRPRHNSKALEVGGAGGRPRARADERPIRVLLRWLNTLAQADADHKLLTSRISRVADVASLAALCKEHGEDFNYIHISLAMTTLSSLCALTLVFARTRCSLPSLPVQRAAYARCRPSATGAGPHPRSAALRRPGSAPARAVRCMQQTWLPHTRYAARCLHIVEQRPGPVGGAPRRAARPPRPRRAAPLVSKRAGPPRAPRAP
jgi:hypothetical protein